MHNTKPIHILRTFSISQLNEFEKYLHSPVFNTNKLVISLFELLKPYAPDLTDEAIHRSRIYTQLFGNSPLDEAKIRYLASDLAKVLEEYISWYEFNKSGGQKNLFLLDYYRKTDLERYFNQILDEENKTQSKNPIKDASWFFHQYLLEENAYLYSQYKKSRSLDNNLQTLVNFLDLFYISNKFKHTGEMLTREVLLKVEYDKPMLTELLKYVEKSNIKSDYLAVNLYYYVLQMHLNPEKTTHYSQLLQLIEQN